MDEDVVNIQVQAHRRADIVCFATVNDSAGIKQNES
jgi:hypothetical protein